jgi:hypothetical protein
VAAAFAAVLYSAGHRDRGCLLEGEHDEPVWKHPSAAEAQAPEALNSQLVLALISGCILYDVNEDRAI